MNLQETRPSAPPTANAVAMPMACGGGPVRKKILIVDDDEVIVRALSLQLEANGYHVMTARDPSEALGVMRDDRPDVILVDVCFPSDLSGIPWDGFRLAEWIRAIYGRTPTLLMSGSMPARCAERVAAARASAFLEKPIKPDQLFASIETALRGEEDGEKGNVAMGFLSVPV